MIMENLITRENFKKYFKLPLVHDEYAPCMVWDSDDNRALDFTFDDKENQVKIVKLLNGELDKESYIKGEFTHKGGEIYLDGSKLLMVRSWGRLTGTGGGLGLSTDKAAEIQDGFCDWIINTLKGEP